MSAVSPRIASAPVNLGVYGGVDISRVDPDAILAGVAAAGYAGMELGPPGLFGSPAVAAARFARHGLAIVGAYLPLHLGGAADAFGRDLEAMRRTLEELVAGGPDALAILADEGSPVLLVNPARAWDDRSLALDGRGWETLRDRLDAALTIVRAAGVRASFHPHISTYVESPWEAQRVLDLSSVGLTMDTGHLRLAGGDPVALLARWADRVDHVHLKDVDVAALDRAKATGRTDFDDWWPETCVPLGTGDASVVAFLGALADRGYPGWIVVEQDQPPVEGGAIAGAQAADARNAAWLRAALDRLTSTGTRSGAATAGLGASGVAAASPGAAR